MADDTTRAQPLSGCLVRIFWMAGGNLALVMLTMAIFRQPVWTFTLIDVLFWALVVSLLAVRYLDVKRFSGQTVRGEPATLRHVQRYTMILVAVAALLWTAAQSVHFGA